MSKVDHVPQESSAKEPTNKLKKHLILASAVLLLFAVVGFAVIAATQPSAQRISRDQYQAVYTTSGQLYFGKLQNTDGEFLVLKTPYTAQNVAAAEGEKADADASTTLLKVSSQLYGPEDSMAIRADQVSFWQNLREDSKVSQAIKSKE